MEAQCCFKVYPASAHLLLPPSVQLGEVLLAFPPRLVVLTSDPPHLLGSSWASTAPTPLAFHFVSPSACLILRHDLRRSSQWFLLLLSSCEFHSLLLISLHRTTVCS